MNNLPASRISRWCRLLQRANKEEDISAETKIIAVIDTWNAMRTDQPYRDALPLEESVLELKEKAGTDFDTEIVEIFLGLVEENEIKLAKKLRGN